MYHVKGQWNVFSFSSTAKRTNNTNNATYYAQPGKKRRECSKCNCYIISPRVTIKAIIINSLLRNCTCALAAAGDIGLFCGTIRNVGLFCGYVRFFCGNVVLVCECVGDVDTYFYFHKVVVLVCSPRRGCVLLQRLRQLR